MNESSGEASMRVASWGDLEYPSSVVAVLVEQLSPQRDQVRFEAARRGAPAIPSGLGHHGIGGAELSTELARLLACPAIERALSVTFVPFSICGFDDEYDAFEVDESLSDTGSIHRYVDGHDEHLIIEAELLNANWPAIYEPEYQAAVEDARAAVRRGAPSALEHRLWLEHFLIEQLLPVAERLALPIEIVWPDRRLVEGATPADALSSQLDAALSSWDE